MPGDGCDDGVKQPSGTITVNRRSSTSAELCKFPQESTVNPVAHCQGAVDGPNGHPHDFPAHASKQPPSLFVVNTSDFLLPRSESPSVEVGRGLSLGTEALGPSSQEAGKQAQEKQDDMHASYSLGLPKLVSSIAAERLRRDLVAAGSSEAVGAADQPLNQLQHAHSRSTLTVGLVVNSRPVSARTVARLASSAGLCALPFFP